MKTIKSYIDNNGKLAIPVKIRKLLKILPGDKVDIKYIDNKLIVTNFREKLERVRALVKQYAKTSLIDELKKMRAEDASNE
jgi:AbrB family looped-hinge helix DNA binding protein